MIWFRFSNTLHHHLYYLYGFRTCNGGIRSGAPHLSRRLRHRCSTGASYAILDRMPQRSNPFMCTKKGCTLASFFCARRRRDSNPRAPEGKRISSAPRYDHFDTSAFLKNMQNIAFPKVTLQVTFEIII